MATSLVWPRRMPTAANLIASATKGTETPEHGRSRMTIIDDNADDNPSGRSVKRAVIRGQLMIGQYDEVTARLSE